MRHDRLGGGVQIAGMRLDGAKHRERLDVVADAVRREHEEIAPLDPQGEIIDFDMRVHAQRAAEIGFMRREDDAVVLRQLLASSVAQAIDA